MGDTDGSTLYLSGWKNMAPYGWNLYWVAMSSELCNFQQLQMTKACF